MKVKSVICIILVASFLLIMNSKSAAVNTTGIDAIRNKTVLNDRDKEVIDEFLTEAIRELMVNRDFTTTAMTRTVILSRYSTEGLYGNWYSELIRQHIRAGFQQAGKIEDPKRKDIVIANLLILIDGLQDMSLLNLAMSMLENKNQIVRYWAVKCLTNPNIVTQINADTENSGLGNNITGQLEKIIADSSPEILAQIARFAVQLNTPQTEELLISVADARIKSYADWTVQSELSDAVVLKSLESKIQSATTNKDAVSRRFAQLYSFVIQRYVKGFDILNEKQKRQLISVMAETEEQCLSKLLNGSQQSIRRAIERENPLAITDEHNRLLGSESSAGLLPSTLGFDYGTVDGREGSTAPRQLPDPPQKTTTDN